MRNLKLALAFTATTTALTACDINSFGQPEWVESPEKEFQNTVEWTTKNHNEQVNKISAMSISTQQKQEKCRNNSTIEHSVELDQILSMYRNRHKEEFTTESALELGNKSRRNYSQRDKTCQIMFPAKKLSYAFMMIDLKFTKQVDKDFLQGLRKLSELHPE